MTFFLRPWNGLMEEVDLNNKTNIVSDRPITITFLQRWRGAWYYMTKESRERVQWEAVRVRK